MKTNNQVSKSPDKTKAQHRIPELYLMPSKELNPNWKGFCLTIASGNERGRILIDQITKKQGKELIKEIKKRGLPY